MCTSFTGPIREPSRRFIKSLWEISEIFNKAPTPCFYLYAENFRGGLFSCPYFTKDLGYGDIYETKLLLPEVSKLLKAYSPDS
jgi:hypothetical protein